MQAVFALVVWLEKTKIRFYMVDARDELCRFTQKWLSGPFLKVWFCTCGLPLLTTIPSVPERSGLSPTR